MAQIFASVGVKEPRLDILGKIYFPLYRQLRAYSREDPPPDRVYPIPIVIIRKCWTHLHDGDAHQLAITYLIYLGFLFLFRPREYFKGGRDTHLYPFSLADV